jgi:ADP-heptose:LPS heptosyltransferase
VILALRALGICDLATGVPALRGLRAAFPDDELVLAAPPWLAALVDLVGGIDRVLPLSGVESLPAGYTWPAGPPRVAVNLHGRGPESHRLLGTARAGRLLGFACATAGFHDGPQWIPGEHEVHRWCRLLRWYGVAADPADLALRRPDAGDLPGGVTVLHPGAKSPARRWPADRFAAVARDLTGLGHDVVVTGAPAERPLAARIARLAGLPDDAVLAGRTGVGELAALIAHARLVICGDTGAGHLATAFGTPSVLLFGPVPPSEWGPPLDRPQHRPLWAGPRAPAAGGGVHPALEELTVADVLRAVPA